MSQIQYCRRHHNFSKKLPKMSSLKNWITMLTHFSNLPTMLVPTKLHRTVVYQSFITVYSEPEHAQNLFQKVSYQGSKNLKSKVIFLQLRTDQQEFSKAFIYSPVQLSWHQHSWQVCKVGQHSDPNFEGNHLGQIFRNFVISSKVMNLCNSFQSHFKCSIQG